MSDDATKIIGKQAEVIASLQRELAEARRENAGLNLFVACVAEDCEDTDYQGDAQGIRDHGILPFLEGRGPVPAPSDVKGEDHIPDVKKMVPLTPLTDPSVRGVLVDDGELTNQLKGGALYINGDLLFRADEDGVDNSNWQPVKLVPASEFGVAARGEPGLKPLPEGAWILFPSGESGEFAIVDSGFPVSPHLGWFNKLDPSLYAMPDWELVKAAENRVMELSVKLAETRGERNQLSRRVKELEAEKRKREGTELVAKRLADAVESLNCRLEKEVAEAERLRKAIETLAGECDRLADSLGKPETTKRICAAFAKTVADDLRAALTPPTAASGETAKPVVCDKCGTELMPDERDGQRGVYGPCTDCGDNTPLAGRLDKPFHRPECKCDRCKVWIAEHPLPPSAPAAESDEDEESDWRYVAEMEAAYSEEYKLQRDASIVEAVRMRRERDALSARLAACEERCKELEEVRVSLIGDRAELYEEWRIASAELDRLRSAIEEHRHRNTGMACDHKKSDLDLWSALAQPGDVKQEKRESLTVPVLDENGAAIGSAKLRTIERGTVAEVTLSKDTAEQIGLSQPGDGEGRTEGELLAQSEADIAAGRLHNHDDVKRELLAAPAAAGDEAEGEPLVDFFVRHINEARDVADEWMARAIDAREKQRAAEKQLDELRHKHMTPDERVAHMKELFVAFDEAAKVAEKSVASIKEHDQKRASERDQLRKRAEDAEANVRKLAPRVESLEADMADLRELWRHLCNSNDTEERESCEKAIHEILENKPSGIRRLDDTTSAASG